MSVWAVWCQMKADERDEIEEVRAGDIAFAAVGLKDVTTGETLCAEGVQEICLGTHGIPRASNSRCC